jgi:endonuclease/exonuclease/phosphatase family metal-dependent hydrolase
LETDEFLQYESSLTLVTQNLFNYRKKNSLGKKQIDYYIKNYKADLYAFQEYPIWGRGRTFKTAFYANGNEYNVDLPGETIDIWKEFFPWSSFPERYWNEARIIFDGAEIIIINVHISLNCSDQLRLLMIKRLQQLSCEKVILVGDFNASFCSQTEMAIPENDLFLSMILKSGFTEVLDSSEKRGEPHYTFALFDQKKKAWVRKKLDHVFISNDLIDEEYEITLKYIDDVNLNEQHIVKTAKGKGFTDHSGIALEIRKKNP